MLGKPSRGIEGKMELMVERQLWRCVVVVTNDEHYQILSKNDNQASLLARRLNGTGFACNGDSGDHDE
jgi:hypothetical protein